VLVNRNIIWPKERRIVLKRSVINREYVQCVPLTIKPSISLIILPLMRRLQRN